MNSSKLPAREYITVLFLISGSILLMLLFGCIDVPTSRTAYEEELTVHCLLRSKSYAGDIYLERTQPIEEGDAPISVSGATIRLFGNGLETVLYEIRTGVYRINEPFWIYEDSTYRLDVMDPEGRHLSETTTVPGHFQILSPLYGASITRNTDLRLTWTKSKGAEEYYIQVLVEIPDAMPISFSYAYTDTTFVIPAERLSGEGEREVKVDIFAIDSNYAEYTRSDPEDPDSPDINNILGARGVFGSYTSTFGFFYIQ